MSIKKKSPVSTLIGIIVLVAVIGILYYGLVLCTQAGPAAQAAAEKAELKLKPESICDISAIPYSMLSEDYKAYISQSSYEEIMKQTAPSQATIELFQKIDKVEGEEKFLQGAAVYYCGTAEAPITGVIEILGIEYEVSHSIEFAPNVENFQPEVINWDISIERITKIF